MNCEKNTIFPEHPVYIHPSKFNFSLVCPFEGLFYLSLTTDFVPWHIPCWKLSQETSQVAPSRKLAPVQFSARKPAQQCNKAVPISIRVLIRSQTILLRTGLGWAMFNSHWFILQQRTNNYSINPYYGIMVKYLIIAIRIHNIPLRMSMRRNLCENHVARS